MVLLSTLYAVHVNGTLLLLNSGWVPAKRLHIGILVAGPCVVASESTVVGMDVRVTTSSVHLVVNGLAWASLTAAASDMCWADVARLRSHSAAFPGRCRLVIDGETTAVGAHVGVSTGAVRSVDLCSASCRQDAHRLLCAVSTLA